MLASLMKAFAATINPCGDFFFNVAFSRDEATKLLDALDKTFANSLGAVS